MRVLFVIPNIVSFESFLFQLAKELINQGHKVDCACSTSAIWERQDKVSDLNINIHPIDFPRGMNLLAHTKSAKQLCRLVDTIKPDIIHAHFSSAIFTTAISRKPAWPSTIGTFQGLSFPLTKGWKKPLLRFAELWSSGQMDYVWVLTKDDYENLDRKSLKPKRRMQKAPGFGCDLCNFVINRSEQDNVKFLQDLGLKDNFIFVFVGRYVKFKGFDLVIRSFIEVNKLFPKSRLLIIGARDPLHTTGLTEQEEDVLRNTPSIMDLGYQKEVNKYLSVSDVFVFPSQREGMPVCLMEASAMGVPIITTDTRGCRDVVRDMVDGIVIRDIDENKLTSAMRMLLENNTLRKNMSDNALRDRGRFSRTNYILEQLLIYESLMNSKAPF